MANLYFCQAHAKDQGMLRAVLNKTREDLTALRKNKVGGLFTLLCKNARKLPQFFSKPPGAA